MHPVLTPTTLNKFSSRVSDSWIFCKQSLGCRTGSPGLVWQKIPEPLRVSAFWQHRLGLAEDSRTSDFWLGLLVLVAIMKKICRQLWAYLTGWLTWPQKASLDLRGLNQGLQITYSRPTSEVSVSWIKAWFERRFKNHWLRIKTCWECWGLMSD